MTEQERQDVIEKAARGIAERCQCMTLERTGRLLPHWIAQAEAALEAVGHFDLRAKLDARAQPVATDEMAITASRAFLARADPAVRWDYVGPKEQGAWTRQMKAALTAALSHAVTRDDVLEELAVEAERDCMTYETTEWDGSSWLADWLRSRKGGA